MTDSTMTLPTELVSKIMVFHSNIRFDKNELVQFVSDWEIVKRIQEENWDDGTDTGFDELENIIDTNPIVLKFYKRYVGFVGCGRNYM